MANEIKLRISFNLENGSLKHLINPGQIDIDQTNARRAGIVQTVGFAANEILDIGSDLTSEGWVYLRNLDATNYVKIGPTSGGTIVDMIKLKPGEPCIFRLEPTTVMRAQANTAAVDLEVIVFDD